MRNKLFQESRTKDCQDIEELRRRCCEESDRARQAKLDELSMMQQRDPQTVSQLLAQMRESHGKVNSLSDAREFHDPETAGSSGASHVTSPPLTNPSYRTVLCCDSGLPPETLNMMGISDVFERLPAREGQPQNFSKNHGIWHLLLLKWNQHLQNIRWQQDRRGDLSNKTYPIRETFSTVEMVFHVILEELILTLVWWSTRDFQSRSCILQNSLTPWNLKAGKSISRLKFVRRQRILKSRCHGSQKLRKQSQLTNRVHRNQFLGEQISTLWNAGCNDSVCIEEDSQLAHSILEKNMCRRATCSKIRPILTRKTDFVHDLWAFSCTQSLWIGTRTLRLVHFPSPEWWCPRFSMSDGIRHYYQQMNHFRIRSWKDCRSQN